jgi:hypothetical protein
MIIIGVTRYPPLVDSAGNIYGTTDGEAWELSP